MAAQPLPTDDPEFAAFVLADEAAGRSGREALAGDRLDAAVEAVRSRGLRDADSLAAAADAFADAARDLRLLARDPDTPGAEREPRASRVLAYSFDDLQTAAFPVRPALMSRGDAAIIRQGTIAELFAYRGLGKTWLAHLVALVVAGRGEALGWHAPEARNVLLVDGEMPADMIRDRLARQAALLGIRRCPRLVTIGADWQPDYLPRVDTPEGQALLEPFVKGADLVILDNRSCLLDSEGEKDPAAWQPTQDYLLSLRRRGKAVLLVHHANRQGGARGIGRAEDVMDVVVKLSRPEDYTPSQGARFRVEFDKARGLHGEAVAPFVAALTEDGWLMESVESAESNGAEQKLREYLATAAEVGELPKTAGTAVREAHVKRDTGLRAFARMKAAGAVIQTEEGYRLA